jgi:hypothetical protein
MSLLHQAIVTYIQGRGYVVLNLSIGNGIRVVRKRWWVIGFIAWLVEPALNILVLHDTIFVAHSKYTGILKLDVNDPASFDRFDKALTAI